MGRTKNMKGIRNLVVIADLHCGCRMALCPPGKVHLDGGGTYHASTLQRKLWRMWREFWDKWVPMVSRGDPWALVINGDTLDGVHHKSTTQISHNLEDQTRIAEAVLEPVIKLAKGPVFFLRGTEAHVGPSGYEEERLARKLCAKPNSTKQHARDDLWVKVGDGLVHFLHHIGTTGSMHYESTAPWRELTEMFAEAGRWRNRPPDMVVRGHRHRQIHIQGPTAHGRYGTVFTCGSWQLKTGYAFKIAGARISTPQIGGHLIRWGDEDGLYVRHHIWGMPRSRTEII